MSANTQGAWGDDQTKFFFELTPERVLEAVESSGLRCTGRCIALNSFENRVYDVEFEMDDSSGGVTNARRVIKFYRPGRWSREQILEEHEFLADLVAAEIPAIAPFQFEDGSTLKQTLSGIWYAIFPKVGGRAPDELSDEQLLRVGRLLARVHSVGAAKRAAHRITLTPQTYGNANLDYLLDRWIPMEFKGRYRETVQEILSIAKPWFESAAIQRVHGDCHPGNLLINSAGEFFFLDFDDMVIAPPAQDLWLLVPGRDRESRAARELLLEGYDEMSRFDRSSLKLIEPLRALRFVHYTAWIARRWEDPAFPAAFPEFNSHAYWADETADLVEQLRVIREEITHGL